MIEDTISVRSAYTVMYANELATSMALDLIERIRKAGLLKNGVGVRVKNLRLELNRYKFRLNDTIRQSMGFYADYCDLREDDMRHHIDVLFYAIHGIVINHRADFADVLSYAEVTRLIAEYAVVSYKLIGGILKENTGEELLPWMNITNILKALEQVSRVLCKNYAYEEIDVNTDNVRLAADIFYKKLIGERVVSAIDEATKMNELNS